MKVWLDDEYEQRKGWFGPDWVHCRWPEDVIQLLQEGNVEVLSLDHDLGEGSGYANPRTGYDVLVWLEEQVFTKGFKPPRLRLHTQNPSAKKKMALACQSIMRKHEE